MKNCSAATQSIISTGSYYYAELWDISLAGSGTTYHFTDGDAPLSNVTIYVPGGTLGPFNYQTGMTFLRQNITQKAGLESGSVKVTMIPQGDSPFSPVLFGGYLLQEAARYGFLDGATVTMSKFFANDPTYTNGQIQTSQGAMGFFKGTMQAIDFDRFFIDVTIEDYLSLLGQQQMPKNLFGVGCFHQVYDAGCTLLASAFTVTGTLSTVGDNSHFTTNLTQADHYFELGVMTMTGGAANGQSANVSTYVNASGAISIVNPFSVAPSPGDTFKVYPGCDRQQATCTTKFSNLPHFGGVPYMPVPETIIDGGTDNPPRQTPGAQAGQLIGSQTSGKGVYGKYNY